MTIKALKRGAVVIALLLPLDACLQGTESSKMPCPPGTQWESFPNQSNTQQGYMCAENR